jgi:hypothetical protein
MLARRDSPDSTECELSTEPTEKNDAADATEPIDSTEPAEPIDRIEPAEPMDRMEPDDPMLRIEPHDPDRSWVLRMIAFSQHRTGTGAVWSRSARTQPERWAAVCSDSGCTRR